MNDDPMNEDDPMDDPADAAPDLSGPLTADRVDLALVAAALAGALDQVLATELAALRSRDGVAADRYAGFARDLDGLAMILADQPLPPVPEDVLVRVGAALQREVAARETGATAHAAAIRRLGRTTRRRPFAGWAAGLGGVAALVAVLAVVIHTGGATDSSSSTAGLAPQAAVASVRAPDAAGAPGAAAAGSASAGLTSSGLTSSTAAAQAAPATTPVARRAVTAATLASVVRAVYPAPTLASRTTPAAATSPLLPVTQGGLGEPSRCRPAGTPLTVRLLATAPVTFAGAPAVLLVLPGDPAHPGSVRATVVASCGGPALLTRLVTVG